MDSFASLGDRNTKSGTTRRTVLKGAAWSVPVIAAATAVPFASASEVGVVITSGGNACKLPGGSCKDKGWTKGYLQPLTIDNPTGEAVTVTIPSTVTLALNGVDVTFTVSPSTFTIPAGDSQRVLLNIVDRGNSPTASITGSIPWSHSDGGSGSVVISTAATPPCDNCTA
ncbi:MULTISPECIES: hypothetical protein [unclassified Microbacterium]|uniref:hypothetical protein n=1 Tax=unclassified Microbacterium TaxID=2609290 RepID=UPI0012F98F2B|nr:hypothetical protein [Microbacterium sp. MAH-37]MVQ42732.1 hypothetical protein [Microbacterium sp. MAH-37]